MNYLSGNENRSLRVARLRRIFVTWSFWSENYMARQTLLLPRPFYFFLDIFDKGRDYIFINMYLQSNDYELKYSEYARSWFRTFPVFPRNWPRVGVNWPRFPFSKPNSTIRIPESACVWCLRINPRPLPPLCPCLPVSLSPSSFSRRFFSFSSRFFAASCAK